MKHLPFDRILEHAGAMREQRTPEMVAADEQEKHCPNCGGSGWLNVELDDAVGGGRARVRCICSLESAS